jgi:hypothetical protein
MSKFITFPKYKDYANNLIIGFKTYQPKSIEGKKIRVILDNTGSMGEMNSNKCEGTKHQFAIRIIKQLITKFSFCILEIMPFSETPLPVTTIDQVSEPANCTYFSPILPVIQKDISSKTEHIAVLFISDGLPTEPLSVAQEAITKIGIHCREAGTNTISLAIGSDADGNSCTKFTGNRGYNCFVKYNSEVEDAVSDISNGIKCNFIMASDGQYIPIEESGNYYYLSKSIVGSSEQPTVETVRKYINLIVQDEIRNPKLKEVSSLIDFVKTIVKVLPNQDDQEQLIKFFTESLGEVKKVMTQYAQTPCMTSVSKQIYQKYTSNSSGI